MTDQVYCKVTHPWAQLTEQCCDTLGSASESPFVPCHPSLPTGREVLCMKRQNTPLLTTSEKVFNVSLLDEYHSYPQMNIATDMSYPGNTANTHLVCFSFSSFFHSSNHGKSYPLLRAFSKLKQRQEITFLHSTLLEKLPRLSLIALPTNLAFG